MKIKIDINEDEELRTYIKGLIKQQVKAIARKEFTDMIGEALVNITKPDNVKRLFMSRLDNISTEILRKEIDFNHYSDEFIKPHMTKIINKRINNKEFDNRLNRLSEQMIKNKLKDLIDWI